MGHFLFTGALLSASPLSDGKSSDGSANTGWLNTGLSRIGLFTAALSNLASGMGSGMALVLSRGTISLATRLAGGHSGSRMLVKSGWAGTGLLRSGDRGAAAFAWRSVASGDRSGHKPCSWLISHIEAQSRCK